AFRRRVADVARDLVAAAHRAKVRVLAGTDAIDAYVVPGFSLHQELELLVASGFTPLEALASATSETARFLGKEKDAGTVEAGKRADLVLLDADPLVDIRNTRRIAAVLLGGRVVSGNGRAK